MTMKLQLAFALPLCILLAGCFGGRSTPPTMYLLTPRATPVGAPYLRIGNEYHGSGNVILPKYTTSNTPQMRVHTNQVVPVDKNVRWAENLDHMVRDTLAQNLASLAGNDSRNAPRGSVSQLHFSRFDAEDDRQFHVRGTATLHLLDQEPKAVFFDFTLPWNHNSPDELVALHDQALVRLAQILADAAKM